MTWKVNILNTWLSIKRDIKNFQRANPVLYRFDHLPISFLISTQARLYAFKSDHSCLTKNATFWQILFTVNHRLRNTLPLWTNPIIFTIRPSKTFLSATIDKQALVWNTLFSGPIFVGLFCNFKHCKSWNSIGASAWCCHLPSESFYNVCFSHVYVFLLSEKIISTKLNCRLQENPWQNE